MSRKTYLAITGAALAIGTLASTSTPTGDALSNHRAGKIRILATSGAMRTPFTPDVASYAEQGFPELTTEEWFGIVYDTASTSSMHAVVCARELIDPEARTAGSRNDLIPCNYYCTVMQGAALYKDGFEQFGT